jgi:hypothetical protein
MNANQDVFCFWSHFFSLEMLFSVCLLVSLVAVTGARSGDDGGFYYIAGFANSTTCSGAPIYQYVVPGGECEPKQDICGSTTRCLFHSSHSMQEREHDVHELQFRQCFFAVFVCEELAIVAAKQRLATSDLCKQGVIKRMKRRNVFEPFPTNRTAPEMSSVWCLKLARVCTLAVSGTRSQAWTRPLLLLKR